MKTLLKSLLIGILFSLTMGNTAMANPNNGHHHANIVVKKVKHKHYVKQNHYIVWTQPSHQSQSTRDFTFISVNLLGR